MATGERPGGGIGCLGTLVASVVVAAIVVLVLTIGFIALVVFAALLVVGLIAVGVDRLLLALSPKRRARRAGPPRVHIWRSGQFGWGPVIDTTVIDTTVIDTTVIDTTVIDTTAALDEPKSQTEGSDEPTPE